LFSKTYTINMRATNNTARFLLNIAVSPYPLSADVTVRESNSVWSASVMVTRQIDVAHRGIVDIVDFGIVALAFDSSMGSPLYSAVGNLTATGTVNINDIGIVALFYEAPDYT
jgi:hypothetical protein